MPEKQRATVLHECCHLTLLRRPAVSNCPGIYIAQIDLMWASEKAARVGWPLWRKSFSVHPLLRVGEINGRRAHKGQVSCKRTRKKQRLLCWAILNAAWRNSRLAQCPVYTGQPLRYNCIHYAFRSNCSQWLLIRSPYERSRIHTKCLPGKVLGWLGFESVLS